MFKEGESSNRRKTDGCFFNRVYGEKSVGFFFNTGKHLLLEVYIQPKNQKFL